MRFVAAIVSFVLAFVLIGLGLAQRTVFAGPERLVAETSSMDDAPVTLIESETLHAHDGRQRLNISGPGDIVAVYGRTADVQAWIGDATHNVLTLDEESDSLEAELVEGEEETVPSALGSDLWLAEYTGEAALTFMANVPEGISVLVMSNGKEAAPKDVSIAWPLDNRTPWAGPLIVAGVVLLIAGIGLYLWALAHWRRMRGPRRKSGKGQKMPRPPKYSARKAAKAVRPAAPRPEASTRGRRSGRARIAVVPGLLIGSLVFTGCSPDMWPRIDEPEPSPSATAGAEASVAALKDVAVTEAQLRSIMADIATVAAEADASLDADLLATRFEGPALEMRKSNYVMRAADGAQPAPTPVHAEPIALSLPQQTDAWPRVALVIVQDPEDETVVPMAYVLQQESPRENYRVQYGVKLQATEQPFPQVAAETVGAVRYSPDNKFLKLTPEQVATAYADVLLNGTASEYAEEFDLENDSFLSIAGPDARAARAAAVSGPVALATTPAEGTGERIALATNDTGALLTLNFGDTETVTPTEAGATISVGPTVKLMTGLTETTKGVYVTYGYQLLFYVPPAGSDEKIRLIGATEGVTAAGELP
ncbi:hypothetical protein FVA74_08300 [Salinibacterium sp. dk2585]|uniref:hypothetical protein n=1 Tax=unclassified Salinibacterium TaxID=2632331 RepID=UPI0011C24CB8|nr:MULTISPECIES: hypothetical protein [unclassified Salinibacterium]QEE61579.1 hypothetical protein FVA74_08300 [Salinibacterium sp. dk2585]TXK52452.1 hypothetical protein FVP63_12790 [Salinibacterium sp. dk5596]